MSIPSEAHFDAPKDLVRVAHRQSYTGNLGGLRGVDFVAGVAQTGCTRPHAERLIGIIGHDIYIVGPWEPPAAPSAPAPPPPAATASPSADPRQKPRR